MIKVLYFQLKMKKVYKHMGESNCIINYGRLSEDLGMQQIKCGVFERV